MWRAGHFVDGDLRAAAPELPQLGRPLHLAYPTLPQPPGRPQGGATAARPWTATCWRPCCSCRPPRARACSPRRARSCVCAWWRGRPTRARELSPGCHGRRGLRAPSRRLPRRRCGCAGCSNACWAALRSAQRRLRGRLLGRGRAGCAAGCFGARSGAAPRRAGAAAGRGGAHCPRRRRRAAWFPPLGVAAMRAAAACTLNAGRACPNCWTAPQHVYTRPDFILGARPRPVASCGDLPKVRVLSFV